MELSKPCQDSKKRVTIIETRGNNHLKQKFSNIAQMVVKEANQTICILVKTGWPVKTLPIMEGRFKRRNKEMYSF